MAISAAGLILENEEKLPSDSLNAIADVFECAFIWYKDPHKRTEFAYRDTSGYVHAWHGLALFRDAVGANAYFDGTHLPPTRRQTVFQAYSQEFASAGLRPRQGLSCMKSCAEAYLRDIAANKMIAFVI